MQEQIIIPRYGRAGTVFAGAEFHETYIFIASILLALVVGKFFDSTLAYLGVPFAGYFINKEYLEWKSGTLPGFFETWLYSLGIAGYSRGLPSQKTIYVGDGAIRKPRAPLESEEAEK